MIYVTMIYVLRLAKVTKLNLFDVEEISTQQFKTL